MNALSWLFVAPSESGPAFVRSRGGVGVRGKPSGLFAISLLRVNTRDTPFRKNVAWGAGKASRLGRLLPPRGWARSPGHGCGSSQEEPRAGEP